GRELLLQGDPHDVGGLGLRELIGHHDEPVRGVRWSAAKAGSKSSGLRTSMNRIVRCCAAAARSRALRYCSEAGGPRLHSTAMRETPGSSASSSTSLATCSGETSKVTPVTLPPGRAKVFTRPSSTGVVAPTTTIGMLWVAWRAANALGVPPATIRFTLASTSSAASGWSRSYRPSAQRYS